MIGFFSHVALKLQARGRSTDYDAERLAQRITEVIDGTWPPQALPMPKTVPLYDPASFHLASDSEMIHEMLRRGFAVMRLPDPKEAE